MQVRVVLHSLTSCLERLSLVGIFKVDERLDIIVVHVASEVAEAVVIEVVTMTTVNVEIGQRLEQHLHLGLLVLFGLQVHQAEVREHLGLKVAVDHDSVVKTGQMRHGGYLDVGVHGAHEAAVVAIVRHFTKADLLLEGMRDDGLVAGSSANVIVLILIE